MSIAVSVASVTFSTSAVLIDMGFQLLLRNPASVAATTGAFLCRTAPEDTGFLIYRFVMIGNKYVGTKR